MAFNTYAGLQTAIATYTNRSNLTNIPDFITLGHARIHYGSLEVGLESEPLRIRAMETTATLTLTPGTASVSLPTGFLQARRLYLNTNPTAKLNPINPDQYYSEYDQNTTEQPQEYAIEGGNVLFGPVPDSAYTANILYYQSFTPLANPSDTNWLLANAPHAYFWSSMIEAYRFIRNMDQAQAAAGTFAGIINSLMVQDKKDRYPGPWVPYTDTWQP